MSQLLRPIPITYLKFLITCPVSSLSPFLALFFSIALVTIFPGYLPYHAPHSLSNRLSPALSQGGWLDGLCQQAPLTSGFLLGWPMGNSRRKSRKERERSWGFILPAPLSPSTCGPAASFNEDHSFCQVALSTRLPPLGSDDFPISFPFRPPC